MTGLPEIVVKLRGVAARTIDYLADKKLRDAADEVEAAVADFNPTLDLPGGVRRIGAALAHANRVYEQVKHEPLIDIVGLVVSKPPPQVKLRPAFFDDDPPSVA